MTVFLTGGSGFLGSHVAEVLKERGHDIIALVRPTSRTEHLSSLGVRMHEGSLEEPESLAPALRESDVVVHVAGRIKAVRPADFYRVNEQGTRGLALAADKYARGGRFILVSSIAAQGPGGGPRERDEGLPEAPVTEYGRSKLAGEKALLEAKGDLDVTILRPPIIYGPRDQEFLQVFQVASRLGLVLCLEREQTVSLVHGRDCARSIVAAAEAEHTPRTTYLMDDGGLHTWPSFAADLGRVLKKRLHVLRAPRAGFLAVAWVWQTWGRVFNTPVVMSVDKIHEAEERYWVAGNAAIKRDLGFVPEFDLESGMRDTIDWARREGLMK
ncbi:MAG: NAD-dependent epimerase/dehydratase family protein [Deltaproteobacteria bacterium]|nr:NAD-dependent epimerase/dehydratase family protein [Deltaproteobacteria bacterium]